MRSSRIKAPQWRVAASVASLTAAPPDEGGEREEGREGGREGEKRGGIDMKV